MTNWQDELEMDEDGRLRKKKHVLPDGARRHFTMEMMDQAAGFSRTFADGSPDLTHWSRPGFRFADSNDPAKLQADAAYEERCRQLDYKTKRRVTDPDDDEEEENGALRQESETERRQRLARKAARATLGSSDARQLSLDELEQRAMDA